MRGAMPLLSQYDFMVWCSVKEKAQVQLYLYLYHGGLTGFGRIYVYGYSEHFHVTENAMVGRFHF